LGFGHQCSKIGGKICGRRCVVVAGQEAE
jgi:hypothetical protein